MDVKVEVTRVVDGREIPPPGTWIIDPSHSEVEFMVRHMMISKVRGTFRAFSGTVVIGEDPTQSTMEVEIEAASIDTGDSNRDEHLRATGRRSVGCHRDAHDQSRDPRGHLVRRVLRSPA